MTIVRKATLEDAYYFAELIIISAPFFPMVFGNKIMVALRNMFCKEANLFSWQHTYFAEVDGKVAGMICGYDWQIKRRENMATGFLLFKNLGISLLFKMPLLLKLNSTIGSFDKGRYYISNLAVYPEYRKYGIGGMLMDTIEKEATAHRAKEILLDVERSNERAIAFYNKRGYQIVGSFSVPLSKSLSLQFYRMAKQLS